MIYIIEFVLMKYSSLVYIIFISWKNNLIFVVCTEYCSYKIYISYKLSLLNWFKVLLIHFYFICSLVTKLWRYIYNEGRVKILEVMYNWQKQQYLCPYTQFSEFMEPYAFLGFLWLGNHNGKLLKNKSNGTL